MKKIISLITILAVVCSMFAAVYATDTAVTEPTIKLTDAQAQSDSTFTLDVCIENNPGVSTLQFALNYDAQYITYQDAECISEQGFSCIATNNDNILTLTCLCNGADTMFNGKLATVTFKTAAVDEDVQTEITVTYGEGDITNAANEKLTFQTVSGKVSIEAADVHTHTMGEWGATDETHSRYCIDDDCDYAETAPHDWTDEEIVKEPTHTEQGEKICRCICGHEITVQIPTVGEHIYEYSALDSDVHEAVCVLCGYSEEMPHNNWIETEVLTAPTHTTEGESRFKCSDCGQAKKDTTEKLPDHVFGEWQKCEDGENHQRVCECGLTETEAHVWDEENVTVADVPTHTEEGSGVVFCKICDDGMLITLPKTEEHEFGEWSAVDDDIHSRECVCGDKEDAPHTWDEGVQVTAPTLEAEGSVKYTCADCGREKLDTIPKLTYVLGDFNGDGDCTLRDANAIFLYVSGSVTGEVDPIRLQAGDFNGDGDCTLRDANAIFIMISGS